MNIPFGKHKGTAVEDAPVDYLKWLVTMDWLPEKFPDLYAAAKEIVDNDSTRAKGKKPAPTKTKPAPKKVTKPAPVEEDEDEDF